MIYVAASPVDRLGDVLSAPGAGVTVLVVPDSALIAGRPRRARGSCWSSVGQRVPGFRDPCRACGGRAPPKAVPA